MVWCVVCYVVWSASCGVWCVRCCRFIERRPGYALTAALIVATGTSTLFSLWWPFPADEVKELNMSHLADAKYGALVSGHTGVCLCVCP